MKQAGIAIDSWKLKIFERRLREAGYTYTQHPGLSPSTLMLKVPFDNEQFEDLSAVVKAAQLEAAERKKL